MPERAEWLRAQVALHRSTNGDDDVGGLLEAACYLAALDEFVVKIGLWDSAERALPITTAVTALNWVQDIRSAVESEMRALWQVHTMGVRRELQAWGAAVAGVPLQRQVGANGDYVSAYANLIVGQLLVEIKTGHVKSKWDLLGFYDQLDRYARLAPAARHTITARGLYLARYGLLMTWAEQPS